MAKQQRKTSVNKQPADASISAASFNSAVHPPCDTSHRILQKAKGAQATDTTDNFHEPSTFS